MKITIYELLGLIKDDKAPKFIKYLGDEYEYVYKDTIQGSYDYKDEYGNYLLVELYAFLLLNLLAKNKLI